MRRVDAVRFGRAVRALRQQRGWRQADLAAAARVSRAVVSRIERGQADRVPVARLEQVATALGARVTVRLDWNGQELDRLLDRRHAALVDALVARLRELGWEFATEVTFNAYGERGSIDVLAWHGGSRSLLVIEVKTVVPDVGAMLATLDRKVRLARGIARERGWDAVSVSRLLVIGEHATARRHVAALSTTFEAAFPLRNVAIRHWLRAPQGEAVSGLWFFSSARGTRVIRRVRIRPGSREHGAHRSPRHPHTTGAHEKNSLG